MRVWYLLDWSETEAKKRSPPDPDPERALKVSIRMRQMLEEASRPRVIRLEDIMMRSAAYFLGVRSHYSTL